MNDQGTNRLLTGVLAVPAQDMLDLSRGQPEPPTNLAVGRPSFLSCRISGSSLLVVILVS
jgi:hypothetical protein